VKLFKNIFIASIVSASMLMPQIAEAGKISKAVGAYTTYKAIQGAAKVGKAAKGAAVIVKEAPKFRGDLRRYIRQMEQYSGRKISKSQLTELKKCLRDPKCYTGKNILMISSGRPELMPLKNGQGTTMRVGRAIQRKCQTQTVVVRSPKLEITMMGSLQPLKNLFIFGHSFENEPWKDTLASVNCAA